MGNTKDTGDETEARIIHELISKGYSVAIPFGDSDRYDLIVDSGDKLRRVQCKTGWLEDGRVRFKTSSKTTEDGTVTRVDYGDAIDAFAVRCRDSGELYWVPAAEAGRKNTYLRVDEPDIDHPSVNRAAEFAFETRLPDQE